MTDTDIIDFSGEIPTLRNKRVTVFDVMLTLDISSEPEKSMAETWDLSQEEIDDIIEYINSNREELERLEEYYTN